jgi:ABC-type transporter Mla MlaB component
MNLMVPARLGYTDSASLFHLQASTATFTGQRISLDCRNLRFVDPLGLCVLHHWFKELEAGGVGVQLANLPLAIETWLRRMNLFADLGNLEFEDRTSHYARNQLQGNVIEVRSVNSLQESDRVANEIANSLLHGVADVSWEPDPEGMRASEGEVLSDELSYVFAELLNNSLDHGRSRGYPHACAKVAAQYYPTLNKLRIAIVDNGCGLLETLRGHSKMEGANDDLTAIHVALMPKVSCNRDVGIRDSVNEGLGLTMSAEMALSSGGKVGIFSGRGRLKQAANERIFSQPIEFWQGTAVFLEFDRCELARLNRARIAEVQPDYQVVPELNFG